MRLLFGLWSHDLGGAEVFTRALCGELARAGRFDVHLLVLSPAGPLAAAPDLEGVSVTTAHCVSALDALLRAPGLRAAISRIAPDCVFLSGYDAALPAIRRAGYRGAVIVVEHGGVILNPGLRPRRRYRTQLLARRAFAGRVQAEVAVSRFMYGVQMRLTHATELVLIPNGIDVTRFAPAAEEQGTVRSADARDAERPLRVGAAGTLNNVKGFGVLVDAAALLRSRGRKVVVTIAGDGPDRPHLKELIAEQGLGDSVHLLGRIDDTPAFYRRQDVVVVPSTSACIESFNLVAVEAQACGIPVVVSRVGALSEVVVHGLTGVTCEPGSAAGLADALVPYSLDRGLRVTHGRAARERVARRYSLARAAADYALAAKAAVSSSRST